MKKAFLVYIMLLTTLTMMGQQPHDLNAPGRQEIQIVSDSTGCRLMVDGKPFFLKGMNWDYFPIGTNYAYSLWKQPDDVIQAALDKEMLLLSEMGVNVIRQYASIPPRWVQYIYEQYGIYTMVNHSFGRYGLVSTVSTIAIRTTV